MGKVNELRVIKLLSSKKAQKARLSFPLKGGARRAGDLFLNSLRVGLLFLSITLIGCNTALFQESQQIPNKIWHQDHTIQFHVDVVDTMKSYDFYIDLRNEGIYPYSNIYMFVNTTFPSGRSARDTVECILANPSGRWLGKGLGDIWDNHILFKQNIRFPSSGTYSFEFDQGMRMAELPAILDVGISIEDHSKK